VLDVGEEELGRGECMRSALLNNEKSVVSQKSLRSRRDQT
jgi:hypothetical protein